MELRHLRYFVAVAKAGHMTRAAAELGIQQPPLSQQIRALENAIGTTLFKRHPKGVSLTDAGRVFLAEARRILSGVDAMEQRMGRVAKGIEGVLHVGFTSSSAAHAYTPEALRECRSRYPGIELVLSENNAAEITEGVISGRLHCGFLRVPVSRPAGLAHETLLVEPVVVTMPLDHRLAHDGVPARAGRRSGKSARAMPPRGVTLRDLSGENVILVRRPAAPGLYANLLALCEARGVRINVVAEVERMMTCLNLVAAGAGISVVPASMQGAHPHALAFRPFVNSVKLDAPLTLVYLEREETGTTARFVELARSMAAHWRERGPAGC